MLPSSKAWSLVTTFDENYTILLFNSRCEELTGLSRSQAIGRKWCLWHAAPAGAGACGDPTRHCP